MKSENYNIFLDSGSGLLPGTLHLHQTEQGLSGRITMLGHGTDITEGTMDGEERRFTGTIWYDEQEVPFSADGQVNDGVLELDISIGEIVISLNGFPVEDKKTLTEE